MPEMKRSGELLTVDAIAEPKKLHSVRHGCVVRNFDGCGDARSEQRYLERKRDSTTVEGGVPSASTLQSSASRANHDGPSSEAALGQGHGESESGAAAGARR